MAIYPYHVKHNGVIYAPGAVVPGASVKAETKEEIKDVVEVTIPKKAGRHRKSEV